MRQRWQDMYQQKLCSADDCAKLLQDGDGIFAPLGNGQPTAIMNAAAKRVRENDVKGIVYTGGVDVKWLDVLSPDIQDRMQMNSGFVGVAVRLGCQKGLYTYTSNRLGHSIEIIADRTPHIKKAVITAVVSPMDEHGFFSSGSHADLAWGSWRSGKFRDLYLEVNEHMPRTYGNNQFHISEVAAVVENHAPLVELPEVPMTKEDEMIGQFIAERVSDGACIQIGIGGMPNAVAKYLKDKKDLGVHSEMLTDSMVDLYYDGVITCAKKNYNRNKMIGSFALGSKKLYDFLNNNPMVEMHCTSYVNDPYIIGLNDNMVSVNATLEVDLTGQCASESVGYKQYSGVGGQLDFIQGAWRSKGGQSYLTLYSTYTDKEGKMYSTIKPILTPGMIVTTARSEVDNIVTEYGVASLKGNEISVRVRDLINIAHPDFRDMLTFEARKMNYIR
ncbi:MAG: acetyl-CoA hydrolase [Firmicutes bacterium]|nr:acetyl-CoA hydrolase [Bacillota bacterium]